MYPDGEGQKTMKKKSIAIKKQPQDFSRLLKEVKTRIQQAQARAMLSVNSELIRLYWDVGRTISEKQKSEGWGSSVIPRLAKELSGELSELKGFSERNLGRMIAFYRTYPDVSAILPPVVAKLESEGNSHFATVFWGIPWVHHVLLMERIKQQEIRFWYMGQILKNGWSRNILLEMIKSKTHERQGKAVSNFARLLPPPHSDLALQELKDPYVFDFLTLQDTFHERELEVGLLKHLEQFLLELGQGFAFVGRQYYLEIEDNEFYLDLLFYHLKLRCFIVIDLKKGKFKPEYAGKMNFYLNVVDDKLKAKTDAPSIGLILCQDRNQIVAEYALRGVDRPIGISEYELTRALPKSLKSSLPTVEEIESELGESIVAKVVVKASTKTTKKKTSKTAAKKKARK
jgi:predicted nuclease of restriction endonuclease-like (RecB) superfamily